MNNPNPNQVSRSCGDLWLYRVLSLRYIIIVRAKLSIKNASLKISYLLSISTWGNCITLICHSLLELRYNFWYRCSWWNERNVYTNTVCKWSRWILPWNQSKFVNYKSSLEVQLLYIYSFYIYSSDDLFSAKVYQNFIFLGPSR